MTHMTPLRPTIYRFRCLHTVVALQRLLHRAEESGTKDKKESTTNTTPRERESEHFKVKTAPRKMSRVKIGTGRYSTTRCRGAEEEAVGDDGR